MPESQITGAVLMIRPVRFESNPQTAESNKFQGGVAASSEAQQAAIKAALEGLEARMAAAE